MIAEGRNIMHPYIVPWLTFLPLLLLTSLWHLLSHSDKNSSPDFRVATRDLRAWESPCPFPRKAEILQSKFNKKGTPLVFQIGIRIHEATKPVLYMAMQFCCTIIPGYIILSIPKVDNIIPTQDKGTKTQRLKDLPKTTWQVSEWPVAWTQTFLASNQSCFSST